MVQAIVIEKETAVKATVIAQRTGSNEIGIMKAMMIALLKENLKEKMSNGIAHFIYAKKNGEVREAWGTTMSNIASAMTNGRGYSKELVNCIAYYDVVKGSWRSFRFESIIKVF